jgi:hypothetical protein
VLRPAAVNAALQGGPQEEGHQPLAALSTALSGALRMGVGAAAGVAGAVTGALGGIGGSGSRSSRSSSGGDGGFQAPPLVLGFVGDRPKSFPLQMRHSGR